MQNFHIKSSMYQIISAIWKNKYKFCESVYIYIYISTYICTWMHCVYYFCIMYKLLLNGSNIFVHKVELNSVNEDTLTITEVADYLWLYLMGFICEESYATIQERIAKSIWTLKSFSFYITCSSIIF